jgi:hypothetical protein
MLPRRCAAKWIHCKIRSSPDAASVVIGDKCRFFRQTISTDGSCRLIHKHQSRALSIELVCEQSAFRFEIAKMSLQNLDRDRCAVKLNSRDRNAKTEIL